MYPVIINILNRPPRAIARNSSQIRSKTPIGMDSPCLHSLPQNCFPMFCKRLIIEWLKKELQNPSELAKKTGIATFNHFYDWMLEKPIKLSDLVDNFFNLRKKPIFEKEEQKTRKSWDVFISIIGKETI